VVQPGQLAAKDKEEVFLPSGDNPEVLKSSDEVILNALPPKPSPASALKAVLKRRLAKVALLEPLSTLSVRTSLR
jgi:hypothetical protein